MQKIMEKFDDYKFNVKWAVGLYSSDKIFPQMKTIIPSLDWSKEEWKEMDNRTIKDYIDDKIFQDFNSKTFFEFDHDTFYEITDYGTSEKYFIEHLKIRYTSFATRLIGTNGEKLKQLANKSNTPIHITINNLIEQAHNKKAG